MRNDFKLGRNDFDLGRNEPGRNGLGAKRPVSVSDHFTLPAHSMDNIELVALNSSTQIGKLFAKQEKHF